MHTNPPALGNFLVFRQSVQMPMPGYVRGLSRLWESILPLAIDKRTLKRNSQFYVPKGQESNFGYIRRGRMATTQILEDGSETIKLIIGEGCLFHESYAMAGFCAFFPMHRCLTDVEMYLFPAEILCDPEFVAQHASHMRNVAYSIAAKNVAMDMVRDAVSRKSGEARIATWLLCCARALRRSAFEPCITQIELGAMLVMHKSSVNRALLGFEKAGIITGFAKKSCEILDMDRLEAIASGNLSAIK